MAVRSVYGGRTAWVVEIDKGACKVLAHRYPDAPNLGDITAIDWATVPPVDILTGGFPCQDVSSAGLRKGLRPGTRSGLWEHFAYAIDQLRPPLVVIENVRGLLSAQAHSDVEPCPWCVGDDPDGAMRALGAVLADLADIGYDAVWCGLRAADVGGCHGRFRVFIAAYPAGSGREWGPAQLGNPKGRLETAVHLLPTPRATDGTNGGPNQRGSKGDLMLPSAVAKLLPTPAVNDMGAGKTPDDWDAWTDRMKTEHGNGNGHGASLSIEALRHARRWGDYAAAITRWESLTRPAPSPTETGPKGKPRLSPRFEEWMMGLPDGWVTDTPGVTWQEAVRMCGNGVVPQQAAAALDWLMSQIGNSPTAPLDATASPAGG